MNMLLLDRPEITDATPREFLAGLAAAGLLAGCGTRDAVPSSRPSGSPVRIAHRYGTTEIVGEPRRIVVVGLTEQDALLTLGVVQVGTTEFFGEYPGAIHTWARAALGDAPPPEVLGAADGVEFERVAALEPDLVVGLYSGLTEADYDRLSRIAPTLAQPAEFVDYGVPWQEVTRILGLATGRAERAEALVAEVEQRFSRVRTEHPEFAGASALVAGFDADVYYPFTSEDPRGRLLSDLGFTVPAEVDELAGESYFAELSRERADLLDVDVLVWQIALDAQRAEIADDPLYSRLDVATQGQAVYLLDDSALGAALSFPTVLSTPFLLDGLVPRLATAIDGDPTTEVPS